MNNKYVTSKQFDEFKDIVLGFIVEQRDFNKTVSTFMQDQVEFNKNIVSKIDELTNRVDNLVVKNKLVE